MTPPLPDRISAAIRTYSMAIEDHTLKCDVSSAANMLAACIALEQAVAEVVAERDRAVAELAEQRRHINRPQYKAMEKERDDANAALRRMTNTHVAVVSERNAATKRADGLAAELSEAKADVRDLTDVLRRNGFRQCDSIICNCNGWHHVDGFAARFREIDDAIGDHNGKTLLTAVQEKLADLAAAQAKLAELHAVASEVLKEQQYLRNTEMHDNYTDRARSREREWKALQRLAAIAAAEQGGA